MDNTLSNFPSNIPEHKHQHVIAWLTVVVVIVLVILGYTIYLYVTPTNEGIIPNKEITQHEKIIQLLKEKPTVQASEETQAEIRKNLSESSQPKPSGGYWERIKQDLSK